MSKPRSKIIRSWFSDRYAIEESARYNIDFDTDVPDKDTVDAYCEYDRIRGDIVIARHTGDRATEAAKRLEMERFLKTNEDKFIRRPLV